MPAMPADQSPSPHDELAAPAPRRGRAGRRRPISMAGRQKRQRRRFAVLGGILVVLTALVVIAIPILNTHAIVWRQAPWLPTKLFPAGLVRPFALTQYVLPTPASGPSAMIAGPDGALYFIEDGVGRIGRITVDGAITELALPAASSATSMAFGPENTLWFTDAARNSIGRVALAGGAVPGGAVPGGAVSEFPLPTIDSSPDSITRGPDGNLWFTEVESVGRITPTGRITEFPLGTGSGPTAITSGPDGNLWFTDYSRGLIQRMTPAGALTTFPLPSGAGPGAITSGPDGNLWFTDVRQNQIGRITPGGKVTEYAIPTGRSSLTGIVVGPDGNLWFTELYGDKVGRMTRDGFVTEFATPAYGSSPAGIAAGTDGAIWFTEPGVNKIGKLAVRASS